MSQIREIRRKIDSVNNIKKITGALQLVAASKMKRTQSAMEQSRPYADKMRSVVGHVALSNSEYHHPYLKGNKNADAVGFIVISSDRGLCGGMNSTLFRKLLQSISDWQARNIDTQLCLIGRKAESFFQHIKKGEIIGTAEHLGEKPLVKDLIGVVRVMINEFDAGKLQSIYIAYNEFVNTMIQQPSVKQLLPLPPETQVRSGHWDYIYEPDHAKMILNLLMQRYIESQVYQAAVENTACFQAAQMVAMKSATDNSKNLTRSLKTTYNKARQNAITRELAEIVAGSDAIT
jgi:F-type H+-transporting ATPase subunit gamma